MAKHPGFTSTATALSRLYIFLVGVASVILGGMLLMFGDRGEPWLGSALGIEGLCTVLFSLRGRGSEVARGAFESLSGEELGTAPEEPTVATLEPPHRPLKDLPPHT